MNTPRQERNKPKKSKIVNLSSNMKKASKAEIGGTKKNKVEVSFALLFSNNHIKIKNAPSETANICHVIAKIKSFEKFINIFSKKRANRKWKIDALNACIKLFAERDKSDPIFFCQIIPNEEEISPTIPEKNATAVRPSIKSETMIIVAPLNPKRIPIHWNLVRVSFK